MKKNVKITEKLSRSPYRGIITEVARIEGSSPQAIWNALNVHNNLRIIEIVSKKMKERKQRYSQAVKDLAEC